MTVLRETARAKVNLTLTVLGRRADGYHEIESLVAFADIGDGLTLDTSARPGLEVVGPFSPSLAGENLIAVTLHKLAAAEPRLRLGHVRLEKCLPVAAGIGGGSADAAAVIRLVKRANPELDSAVDWSAIAAGIGADVPVCLANAACWMRGIGDRLMALSAPLPPLPALLANPRVAVPADKTARVFRALGAPALHGLARDGDRALPRIPDSAELVALMRRCGNDLEAPATAVVGALADVMAALESLPGTLLAQASGAGPTCFAVFDSQEAATEAAHRLRAAEPSWWVEAVTLA